MSDEHLDDQETWETTTGGLTFIHTKDPLNSRVWVEKKVGGPNGAKRIVITTEERKHNQSMVAYGNEAQDPFLNGLLVRILPATERLENELTDKDLIELLQGGSDDDFEATIASIESEVILRRMHALTERNATPWRANALQDLINERWPAGKGSRVYEEMRAARDRLS